ncbi:MAG: hypothetical protein IH924_06340 [Proteobacteria bacterium]|nr:hypothetical protein [Pseudomonadota bacterium]
MREEVFAPLGMVDSWVGLPPDRYEDWREITFRFRPPV